MNQLHQINKGLYQDAVDYIQQNILGTFLLPEIEDAFKVNCLFFVLLLNEHKTYAIYLKILEENGYDTVGLEIDYSQLRSHLTEKDIRNIEPLKAGKQYKVIIQRIDFDE